MVMEPTEDGAYIEIRLIRKTWKEAAQSLNGLVYEIDEIVNQIKTDDPIAQWKEEERRKGIIAGEIT